MTAADVLAALRRRWYVALVGVLLTATGALFLSSGHHIYSARASVVFLKPGSVPVSQTDDVLAPYLVNFAAMVRFGLTADEGEANDRASFGGSLIGAGVTKGYAVVLPNSGGQWSQYYNQPLLTIEAVDSTPQAAEDQVKALMRQIDQVTADLQARLMIPATARVTTSAQSTAIEIVDGGATKSTRLRGLLALGGLGVSLSVLSAVIVDRLVRILALRGRRRAAVPGARAPVGALR